MDLYTWRVFLWSIACVVLGQCFQCPNQICVCVPFQSGFDVSCVKELSGEGLSLQVYVTANPDASSEKNMISISNQGIPGDILNRFQDPINILKLTNNNLSRLDSSFLQSMSAMEILSLSQNPIQTLPTDVFQHTPSLRVFHMEHSQLESLPQGIFQTLPDLSVLHLPSNKLHNLPNDFLKNSLRDLDLSYNQLKDFSISNLGVTCGLENLTLESNFIHKLKEDAFSHCVNLAKLNLKSNQLTTMPDNLLFNLSGLVTLDLSNNGLMEVPEDFFLTNRRLRKLLLTGNKLSDLPEAMCKGTQLSFLSVQGNELTELQAEMFYGCEFTLSILDISFNKLQYIAADAFSKMKHLITLNLQGNRLSAVNPNTFLGNPSLKFLDLSQNELDFSNITIPFIPEKMYQLNLSYNHLQNIPSLHWHRLKHLIEVDLSNNAISTVYLQQLRSFWRNDKTRTLHRVLNQALEFSNFYIDQISSKAAHYSWFLLSNNPISQIVIPAADLSQDEVIPIQTKLSLSNISLNCNCQVVNLLHYLRRQTDQRSPLGYLFDKEDLVCSSPETLKGVSVLNLPAIFESDCLNVGHSTPNCDIRLVEGFSTMECTEMNLNSVPVDLEGQTKVLLLDKNNITDFNGFSQGNWKSLTHLSLKHCNLGSKATTDLPQHFSTYLKNLQFLDLSYNDISILPKNFLKGLQSLKVLVLRGNRLKELPDLSFSPQLEALDAGSNDISSVEDSMKAPGLMAVILANNSLQTITSKTFRNLTVLETLDLSSNNISRLDSNIFSELYSIRIINMSYNHISTLEKLMIALPKFNISHGAYPKLTIDLGFNNMTYLNLSDFIEPPANVIVSVENNNIRTIIPSEKPQKELSKAMPTVFFTYNPIHCDCKLAQVLRDVKSDLIIDVVLDLVKCYTPVFLRNADVADLDPEKLICHNATICVEGCSCYTSQNGETIVECLEKNSKYRELTPTDSIYSLQLRNQDISSISFGGGHWKNLRNLMIHHSRGKSLSANTVTYLPYLTVADFSRNEIEDIDEAAFSKSEALESLDICRNALKSLKVNTFSSLVNLRNLDCGHNFIDRLEESLLQNNNKLIDVDFGNNSLISISPRAFANCSNLETLILSFNLLSSSVVESLFLPKSLKFVDLSHNRIQHISRKWDNLPLLKYVDLSWNGIVFASEIYDGIYFWANGMLPSQFDPWGSANSKISLEGNYIQCGCEILDILKGSSLPSVLLLNATDREMSFRAEFLDMRCKEPAATANKTIRSLIVNGIKQAVCPVELTCHPSCECTQNSQTKVVSSNCASRNLLSVPHKALRNTTTLHLDGNAGISLEGLKNPVWKNLTELSINQCGCPKCTHGLKLSAHTFSSLLKIRNLQLARNFLQLIPDGIFDPLTELQDIDLSGNYLKTVSSALFRRNTKLLSINLSGNSFLQIPMNFLQQNSALLSLNLSKNQIHTIKEKDLENFRNLTDLDISMNKRMNIEPRSFQSLSSLKNLNLSENEMSKATLEALHLPASLNIIH